MNSIRTIALAGLVLAVGTTPARGQDVIVDVGVSTDGFGARVRFGPPVVYQAPRRVVVYEPVVFFEYWPVAYWEYVRVHDPHRYVRYRQWRDWERRYHRAWREHRREELFELRRRQARYFRDREDAGRSYRRWARERDDNDDDDRRRGRSRDRGRGHDR